MPPRPRPDGDGRGNPSFNGNKWLQVQPPESGMDAGRSRLEAVDEAGGNGVDDGTRTRDNRNHNPGLYQLSYVHHSRTVACPTGLEPVTPSLEGWCSIRMSYGHQNLEVRDCCLQRRKPDRLWTATAVECYLPGFARSTSGSHQRQSRQRPGPRLTRRRSLVSQPSTTNLPAIRTPMKGRQSCRQSDRPMAARDARTIACENEE